MTISLVDDGSSGSGSAGSVLLGRQGELRRLEHLLDRGREYGGGVLVRGEAGIGKTSLLAAASAAALARGYQVLSVVGLESEAALPWAALHRLLRPVLDVAGRLPGPQRGALLGAFGMSDAGMPGAVLTGLGTLTLLSECAGGGAPLLIVVDDAQWIDAETRAVLGFVSRRLDSDPVVMVVAERVGEPSGMGDAALDQLDVGPLDGDQAAALLDACAPGLRPARRARILAVAAGNPLALTELPATMGDEAGEAGTAVRMSARLERSFAARLRPLSPAVRSLLLVAALDDGDDVGEIVAAAGTLPNAAGIDELDAALDTGLVAVDDGHLRFRHPLVRSAVVAEAQPAARRATHAALAEALLGQPDRRAWHRARASAAPDAAVAAELEAAAVEARRRGGIAAAIRAQEEAARLTPRPRDRASRLLAAAEMAFDAGRPGLVERLLGEAQHLGLTRVESRRATWIRELFEEGTPGDPDHVRVLVETAGAAAADGDPALCLNLLVSAAATCWWAEPGSAARALVVDAAERHLRGDPRALALVGIAEPIARAAPVIAGLSALAVPDEADPQDLRLLGMGAHAAGDFSTAARFLAAAAEQLRVQGRVALLVQTLAVRAHGALETGDLQTAVTAADECCRLAEETRQPIWHSVGRAAQAEVLALRGESEATERLLVEAERVLLPRRLSAMLAVVEAVRGRALLVAGRPVEAFQHLRRCFDPADVAHYPRELFRAIGPLAEAAVLSGCSDEARSALAPVERAATISPAAKLRIALAYARAVLAPDDAAESLYGDALSITGDSWPLERARLQLAHGAWLRRRRRARESRAPLRASGDTFEMLGLAPLAERARQELRASGEVRASRRSTTWTTLSAQELQIARLAAEGLSNAEIGERLFLSHRTVGSHLYRAFPKLGITARAQLRDALTETGPQATFGHMTEAKPHLRG